MSWYKFRLVMAVCAVLAVIGYIYDLGIRMGQMSALKTAYEVCKKVAPLKDGSGCV